MSESPLLPEIEAALARVREYLAALDGLYGDEEIPNVLDNPVGDHRSPSLLLSDIRTLAALSIRPEKRGS